MKSRNLVILFVLLCFSRVIFGQSFRLKTEEAGLSSAVKSNGVAVADYDLDGDLDIYFVGQMRYDENDPSTWNRLFRNGGDGTFEDVTEQAGVVSRLTMDHASPMGFKFGANWGDYDNDGDPDLYLTNFGPNELYKNRGDGTFVEIPDAGAMLGDPTDISTSGLWWDYDLDGDLDMYVSVWGGASTDPKYTANKMYENVGSDTFLDVTRATALGDTGRTWTSVSLDADNDGLPDLYVVNDFGRNKFYRNNGDKTFVEATVAFGLEDAGNGMGVTLADYNNDGFFDIYLTNIADLIPPTPNSLFTNTGGSFFVNKSIELGVDRAGWAWGTEFFDCDHDGDLDLYVVNGFFLEPGNNYFFLNNLAQGSLSFRDVSVPAATDGAAEARGLSVFDYDDDGDLDMLVANFREAASLYENITQTQNWLKIELEGTLSNRNAFGAKVRAIVNGKSYYRYNDGVDFLGQSIQPLHFGLGDAEVVDEIHIRWPNGVEESVFEVLVNQKIKIKEGVGLITRVETTTLSNVPSEFQLLGNYPNPFNGSTVVEFELPEDGRVNVMIRNVLGQQVRTIRRTFTSPGRYQIRWDGTDDSGNPLGSGFYLYEVRFQKSLRGGRMLYLK